MILEEPTADLFSVSLNKLKNVIRSFSIRDNKIMDNCLEFSICRSYSPQGTILNLNLKC